MVILVASLTISPFSGACGPIVPLCREPSTSGNGGSGTRQATPSQWFVSTDWVLLVLCPQRASGRCRNRALGCAKRADSGIRTRASNMASWYAAANTIPALGGEPCGLVDCATRFEPAPYDPSCRPKRLLLEPPLCPLGYAESRHMWSCSPRADDGIRTRTVSLED